MFNSVDLVGAEAVANCLKQTDLKRFIIYRQGAGKGSTPVYDCSHTTSNGAAVKCFRDWATNIMQWNPNNLLCYEVLMFNDFEENIGADPQNKNPNEEENRSGRKRGKIRVSFALNAQAGAGFNQQTPGHQIDIAGEIQKGIELAILKMENERLKKEIKELESDDDDDEEEEESEIGDVIGKVRDMMKEINDNNRMQLAAKNGAQVNGDLDGMTEDKTKKNIHGLSDQQVKEAKESLNRSLKILWQHNKDLPKDLAKLAEIAGGNKVLYNMILDKLRSF